MDWQIRRKFLYGSAVIIALLALVIYFFRDTLFPAPTCFDGKQNGYEVGVDCGGICAPRCASEVQPLVVLWTRALKTSATTYDLVAMVSNKNIDNASHSIAYSFVVYDAQGRVMKEVRGNTIAPISGDFPVLEQSVILPQFPRNVTLQIQDDIHYKVNEKPTSPTLRIGNERYEAGTIPRVYATVVNTKQITIRDLPVIVVLFDQNNNAYAVGKTLIPQLNKEEAKEVSFTWDFPLASSPLRIKVYPLFDPFLSIP